MFSIFWSLILHFALPPRIYSFGQNTKCWCSLRVFWVLILGFFCFLLGYFRCVYVCVWVCMYTVESKLETSFIYPPPYPSRNKANLYICYFLFFLMMHRINKKWGSWISNLRRFLPLEVLVLICLVNIFLIFSWA